MNDFKIREIARVNSPYKTKFGAPRQSGLVRSDQSIVELVSEIELNAFEELRIGNFLWVIFIFDQCEGVEKQQVRPPRLGGNKKIGVYATRSPFRPNNIGLSLCQLEKIESTQGKVKLFVSGLDLANKTPVIDIKPYHPVYDQAWEESEYWFGQAEVKKLNVELPAHNLSNADLTFIKDVLAGDPRPAYHDDENRVYTIELRDYVIKFQVLDNKVIVKEIG